MVSAEVEHALQVQSERDLARTADKERAEGKVRLNSDPRISEQKSIARVIDSKHDGLSSILESISRKGAFYVNCCFNVIAGNALGGPLMAVGSLFNDLSMKSYIRILSEDGRRMHELVLAFVTFLLLVFNTFLCILIFIFMCFDMAENEYSYKVGVLEKEISRLEENRGEFHVDSDNYALLSRSISEKISESSDLSMKARDGRDYSPVHAIFHKTKLDPHWATVFMAFVIMFNAIASILLEKGEVTTDDLDENGKVIPRKSIFSMFKKLGGTTYVKPRKVVSA